MAEALHVDLWVEQWPLARPFTISRGSRTTLDLLCCEIARDGHRGRAEAVGVSYRGETAAGMRGFLEEVVAAGALPGDRETLREQMQPGGPRNAVDCALWDLEAKASGRRAWELAGIQAPRALQTTYTVAIGDPARMAEALEPAPEGAVLKLKLGGGDGRDVERVEAARRERPDAEIVVDVNEGWSLRELNEAAPRLARLGVALIEQPLPAADDTALAGYSGELPLCADESFQDSLSFDGLHPRYGCINIKLDKTGGLTEALRCVALGRARGLALFVGNMLGTSLGMAPAFIVGQHCRWVDLDGPLLLARDRDAAIRWDGPLMQPFGPEVWG